MEHVGRERSEGEDGAVKGDAEQDNVPVGRIELLYIGEDDLVAAVRLRQREYLLAMQIHGVVNQVAEHTEEAEGRRRPKRDAIAAEIAGDEFFGVEAEEGPDAADGKSDAESEGHFLAFEPAADDGALHHDERLRAGAEDQPPGEELPTGMGCGYDRGAHEDEQAEQKAGSAGAQLVVEHAPKKDDDNGGHRVGRVEIADGAAVQVEIRDERGRESADAVVGEIASQNQQADKHQDGEAVGPPGWMEESHGFRSGAFGNERAGCGIGHERETPRSKAEQRNRIAARAA